MTTTLPSIAGAVTTTMASTSTAEAAVGTTAQKSTLSDMDDFLRLFLTQLKNQDPTAPMDVQESMSQLSQFAQVEQLTKLSTKLDSLYDTVQGQAANLAQSYIGRQVTVEGSGIAFDGVTLPAFSYEVPQDSRKVTVQVLNEAGSIVRTLSGSTSAGTQKSVWDGRTDAGQIVSAGNYSLKVTAAVRPDGALDTTDAAVPTKVSGRVEAVEFEAGKPWLIVGGKRVAASDILSIQSPAGAVAPATAASPTTVPATAPEAGTAA
ncbi:flagellar hook capping FlgD N-terminal domain-containing protein [Azospirillum sp. SYSU D00513]|uniref:flagellar hook assembly protein FlgD n=1 Tax=Azospirillum sp. SYSU D00513 TaxID=2812561 RepID=UPI001A96B06A|nr:flagellar hook capping FlgD N-terminal domain-containing protein [Azospirillum sp. SYSU D00513]